jgi:hypothetical protein
MAIDELVQQAFWLDAFAPLAEMDAEARAALTALSEIRIPRGKSLFSPGRPARASSCCLKLESASA